MSYTHTVTVPLAWEEAVQRTREALAGQGFGILSEIDVRATFAAKLGAAAAEELGDYVILGACNPALASRALSAEPDMGALLPCNVVVRRGKDADRDDHPGHRPADHGQAQRQPRRPGRRQRRRYPPPRSPGLPSRYRNPGELKHSPLNSGFGSEYAGHWPRSLIPDPRGREPAPAARRRPGLPSCSIRPGQHCFPTGLPDARREMTSWPPCRTAGCRTSKHRACSLKLSRRPPQRPGGRNAMNAALISRAAATLRRGVVLTGLLAIVAGILGMHIMTGMHGAHALPPLTASAQRCRAERSPGRRSTACLPFVRVHPSSDRPYRSRRR